MSRTAEEKLDYILSELKRVALPDENDASADYWMEVQCEVDNAVDSICGTDEWIKDLIKYIES